MAFGNSDDSRETIQNDENLLLSLVVKGREVVCEEAAEVDVVLQRRVKRVQ